MPSELGPLEVENIETVIEKRLQSFIERRGLNLLYLEGSDSKDKGLLTWLLLRFWFPFLIEEIDEAIESLDKFEQHQCSDNVKELVLEFVDVFLLMTHILFVLRGYKIKQRVLENLSLTLDKEIQWTLQMQSPFLEGLGELGFFLKKLKRFSIRFSDSKRTRRRLERKLRPYKREKKFPQRSRKLDIVSSRRSSFINEQLILTLEELRLTILRYLRFVQKKYLPDVNMEDFFNAKLIRNEEKFNPHNFEQLKGCGCDFSEYLRRYYRALEMSRRNWSRNNGQKDIGYFDRRAFLCCRYGYEHSPFEFFTFEVIIPSDKKLNIDKTLNEFIKFLAEKLKEKFGNSLNLVVDIPFHFNASFLSGSFKLTLSVKNSQLRSWQRIGSLPDVSYYNSHLSYSRFSRWKPRERFVAVDIQSIISTTIELIDKNLERFLTSRAQT